MAHIQLPDGTKLEIGTAANNLVQLGTDAKLPAIDASALTNIPGVSTNSVTGPGPTTTGNVPQFADTVGNVLGAGLVVGTAASNLVQLTGDGKLPAVDGSSLTNLPGNVAGPATVATGGNMAYFTDTAGRTLGDAGFEYTKAVRNTTDSSVTTNRVAQIADTAGNAIKAGPEIGTAADNILQLGAAGELPAINGTNLTGGQFIATQGNSTNQGYIFIDTNGDLNVAFNSGWKRFVATP